MTEAKTPLAGVPGNGVATHTGARPYRSPELIEYGSITKLTQGTKSTKSDGPGGGFKKKAKKPMM